jgi:hypothetical protein
VICGYYASGCTDDEPSPVALDGGPVGRLSAHGHHHDRIRDIVAAVSRGGLKRWRRSNQSDLWVITAALLSSGPWW